MCLRCRKGTWKEGWRKETQRLEQLCQSWDGWSWKGHHWGEKRDSGREKRRALSWPIESMLHGSCTLDRLLDSLELECIVPTMVVFRKMSNRWLWRCWSFLFAWNRPELEWSKKEKRQLGCLWLRKWTKELYPMICRELWQADSTTSCLYTRTKSLLAGVGSMMKKIYWDICFQKRFEW